MSRGLVAALVLLAAPATEALAQGEGPPLVQEIATIRIGQTRVGQLEAGDYTMGDGTWADVWIVEVPAAGHRLIVDVSSRAFDTYVLLLDAAGARVADDDDSGPGSNSMITFAIREAGRYQIVVNASGDTPRTGQYSISVR